MSALDKEPEMTLQHTNMVVCDGLPAMSYHHFEEIRNQFLQTQDDLSLNEWYCTHRKVATDVFKEFEDFLFKIDRERQARYAMYLQLKAEFDKGA